MCTGCGPCLTDGPRGTSRSTRAANAPQTRASSPAGEAQRLLQALWLLLFRGCGFLVHSPLTGTMPHAFTLSSQSSSVQLLSRVRLFPIPRTAARQASLSIHQLLELTQTQSLESVTPSSHLILCVRPTLGTMMGRPSSPSHQQGQVPNGRSLPDPGDQRQHTSPAKAAPPQPRRRTCQPATPRPGYLSKLPSI